MLECKILTSIEEVKSIADEWRQLYARARTSPIVDYDRFLVQWDAFGKHEAGRSMHVVVGYRDGKLAAVLPLTVLKRKFLRFLQSDGGGDAQCDILTDTPADMAAVWEFTRKSPHYDVGRIRGAYPRTLCQEQLRTFAQPSDDEDYFFLNIQWPTRQDWEASLPGSIRTSARRRAKRLGDKGPVTYEVCQSHPLPHDIIDAMMKHKVEWASRQGKEGHLHNPHIFDYYHNLAKAAADQGSLFLAWLKCGDDIIAYNFAILDQGVLHSNMLSYDVAYAKYSPGELIKVNTIGWAIEHGVKAINYMYTTGTESEKLFKAKYANDMPSGAEYIFSHGLRGKILENLYVHGRALKRKLTQVKAAQKKSPESEEA